MVIRKYIILASKSKKYLLSYSEEAKTDNKSESKYFTWQLTSSKEWLFGRPHSENPCYDQLKANPGTHQSFLSSMLGRALLTLYAKTFSLKGRQKYSACSTELQ